jgi:transcriptional regulator with XRE-family HTH domain
MTAMTNAVAKTIDDLRERGGLRGVDVANVTNVSKATVSRWSAGKAAPQPRMQLLLSDLRYVVDRLSEFYTPDEARTWLYSRNALLEGERAMDLIHEGRTEEVLLAIERLAALSYL